MTSRTLKRWLELAGQEGAKERSGRFGEPGLQRNKNEKNDERENARVGGRQDQNVDFFVFDGVWYPSAAQ
jgi:hypothetical protein